MKTLYLVRHAKSSWENLSIADYERPLLEKGIKRSKKVGACLQEKGVTPQLILSSHAQRAWDTARILATALNYPEKDIIIENQLYFSGAEALENIVYGLPDDKDHVMMVGHNPDMTRFANLFLEDKIDYMSTSSVVCVLFHTQRWQDIMLAEREIPFVVFPKSL